MPRADGGRSAWAALARRAFGDARVRTISFAVLFMLIGYANVVGYSHSYRTLRDRLEFARSFGGNKALRLFYGQPHDLASVGGYSAWRVGGTLAIFAAVWGVLASVRILRAEEESGRAEVVLSAPVTRASAFTAGVAAVLAGALLLWLACLAGLTLGGLSGGGSAALSGAVVAVAVAFAGIGAVVSQLATTRRMAIEIGGAAVALAFVLRVIADTSTSLGWLRWATPLGWAEEVRPFTGTHLAVLLAPLALGFGLLWIAHTIQRHRDVGTGALASSDTRRPRTVLLSSLGSQALRTESLALFFWLLGVGSFAFILGIVSKSISANAVPASLRQELTKLGSSSILTPQGYLGFTFVFFVFAFSLFVCGQIAAARHEESEERLETLLALPTGRLRWLASRLVLAALAVTVLSLAAGALAWAGARSQGVHLSFGLMLGAGANCLPAALLFLALGALGYALFPRAGTAIAYGIVSVAYVWQVFGAVLGAPRWLLDLTPFHHVAVIPGSSFKTLAAAAMIALTLLAAGAAAAAFRRRDLIGA